MYKSSVLSVSRGLALVGSASLAKTMAAHPKSLILMQYAQDFEILRDFCFREGLDFIVTEVAGHRGVALFGSPIPVLNYSSQQRIGIFFNTLVDLGSTSPQSSFHPNTPQTSPSSSFNSGSVASDITSASPR